YLNQTSAKSWTLYISCWQFGRNLPQDKGFPAPTRRLMHVLPVHFSSETGHTGSRPRQRGRTALASAGPNRDRDVSRAVRVALSTTRHPWRKRPLGDDHAGRLRPRDSAAQPSYARDRHGGERHGRRDRPGRPRVHLRIDDRVVAGRLLRENSSSLLLRPPFPR